MAKYIVETVHKLTQKVEQDNASIQKARKTIDSIKSQSEEQIRGIYKTQEAYTKQTTNLKLAAYKNDSQYFKATTLEKNRIIAQGVKAQVASIEYLASKQIALYKEEIAWIKRVEAQKVNSTLGVTKGGAATPSTANPGGSSTQGITGLGGVSSKNTKEYKAMLNEAYAANEKFTRNVKANEKLLSDARTSYYTKYRQQRLEEKSTNSQASRARQQGYANQRKALKENKKSLDTYSSSAKKAATDTHTLFGTMTRAMITVPAFYSVAKGIMLMHDAIGAAITRTIEFDLASRTLAAVLDGQSIMATREATKAFTALSMTLGGVISDYEKAALLLARSGIGDKVLDDLTQAVGITAQLSLITGESLELAASAIITFKQAYSKGADGLEAYGGALQDIGDKIAFMANASKLSLQDIGTFSNYAVAAGKAAGLTQDSLNGMAIAFSNAGNKASTIGTQIRRFTATLTSSREGVINLYKSIGVNRTKLNADLQKSKSGLKEDIKSSNEAFKEFVLSVAALDQVGYNQATAGMAILDKQFFDNLRNNSAEILDNVETSFDGVSGALDKTGIMADSLGKRWEAMGNKMILGSQDTASAVASYFTDSAERIAESFAKIQNYTTGDTKEAAVNAKAQDALIEAIKGRRRLGELQKENLWVSADQVKLNNKEANLILSNINLKKVELGLLKQQADADSWSLLNWSKRGKFSNKQLLDLDLVQAKQRVNAAIQRDALEEEIELAKKKVQNVIDAQKYMREEENSEKRLAGIKQVALIQAEKLAGYADIGKANQDATLAFLEEQLKIQSKINLRKATDKDDMSNTKAFISLASEEEAYALIEQRINTNIKALKTYEKQIEDISKGTIEEEKAQAQLVLSLQKQGKHRQANVQLADLMLKLSKNDSTEAQQLMSLLSGIKPIMGSILDYKLLGTKLDKERAAYQAKMLVAEGKLYKISADSVVANNKLLTVQGKMTKEHVAMTVATTKQNNAIDANKKAQKEYTDLIEEGIDHTKNQKDVIKQIDTLTKAYTKTQETSLEVTKTSITATKAIEVNARAMANEILRASNNAISLASNLRSAVSAFNNMILDTKVLNGTMTAYGASVAKHQGAIATEESKIKDLNTSSLEIKKQLLKTGKDAITDAKTREKYESDILKNENAKVASLAKIGDIQNNITRDANNEYKRGLEHKDTMKRYADELNAANGEVLDKKHRASVATKQELANLERVKATALEIANMPGASSADQEAAAAATTALAERRKQLKEEELDLNDKLAKEGAKAASAAAKAAKIADKAASDKIKTMILEHKIAYQMFKNKKLAEGVGTTDKDKYKWRVKLLALQKAQAKAAWVEAKAAIVGDKSRKEAQKAHLAYLEAIGAEFKNVNDEGERLGDVWADMFDSFAEGDIIGTFEGLMDGIKETMNIEDMGQSWSKVFASLLDSGKAFAYNLEAALMSTGWYAILSLGVKLLSSMGSTLSEAQLQEAEGITTVLSDSATNSIDLIAKNSTIGLKYSSQMVHSLQALINLSDTASAQLGTTLSGDDYVANNKDTLWGGRTEELLSTGIRLDSASIQELTDGLLTGYDYRLEKVTKSSWFGLASKESLKETNLGETDAGVLSAISQAYLSGVDAMEAAATVLGMTEDKFTSIAATWETTISKLNFEGKDAAERAEMIAGVISNDLDSWGDTLGQISGYVEEYKNAGEGTFETIIRMANGYEILTQELNKMGIAMNAVGEGGLRMSEGLAEAAGGIEKLVANLSYFYDNFYTDEEQIAMKTTILQAEFARLGITLPTTIEGMKTLVNVKLTEIQVLSAQITTNKAKIESDWAVAQANTTLTSVQLDNARATYDAAMIVIDANQKILDNLNIDFDSIMSSLPMWTDIYGTAEEAKRVAEEAKRAREEAAQLIETLRLGIASLTAEWTVNDVESANLILDAVIANTGLTGIDYNNFLEEFKKIASTEMEESVLADWQELSNALKSLYAAQEELIQEQKDMLQVELDFYKDVLSKIEEAYLGSLSYLTTPEKAEYSARMAEVYLETGDTQSYFDALYKQLEHEKKMSVTKEEYIPKFDEYIRQLKDSEPESTLDDVVENLKDIQDRLVEIEDAIEKAAYQEGV